jgi:hypothetical protein
MAERATSPDLTNIEPVSESYATAPVAEAFNWDECAEGVDAGEWYLVAFRSVLRESADRDRLWESDRRAHEEAARASGFIHYFKGPPNDRRECLSFCVWESREHARAAARGTAHLEAVELIHEMYESYVLEFLQITKGPGVTGFRFEAYDRIGAA